MKNFIKAILISLILLGCSGGGSNGDDTHEPPTNNAPTVPTLIYPTNNLLCINNTLDFEWNTSADSDGDAITYEIEISKNNQFSSLVESKKSTSTKHTFTLEKGLAYYWRVKAIDSKNKDSNYSSVFSLYTEGDGISNHLPFAPDLIKPAFNAVENEGTISLEWNGRDTDSDPLTYDVYFGTNNSPTNLVSENQSETIFSVNVQSGVTYYWKIVVKDDKGGETVGQIWIFSAN